MKMKQDKKKAHKILIRVLEMDFQWYLLKHPQLIIWTASKQNLTINIFFSISTFVMSVLFIFLSLEN